MRNCCSFYNTASGATVSNEQAENLLIISKTLNKCSSFWSAWDNKKALKTESNSFREHSHMKD